MDSITMVKTIKMNNSNNLTIKEMANTVRNERILKEFEEATQKPLHIMDDIIKKNDKFETINVLLMILCKELGISTESQPKEVLMGIGKVYEEYYKAMEDFKELRNANQGRDGKKIDLDEATKGKI